MKKALIRSLIVSTLIFNGSCKKTVESMINCTGESLFMSVHSSVDASSPKLVHLEARYSGTHSVESVTWEFGDGKTLTVKDLKTDHTYAASGAYNVKAKIKIMNGKSSCESDHAKSVVIN